MKKRMTDTAINRQPWFRKLKPKMKCAVRFLFDECDNAGVWVIDMETLSYFVGEDVTLEELFEKINSDKENRIEKFGKDKIFIPGFVDFQYGCLSEDCRPHKPVISLLKKYNLYERVLKGYQKGINTLEEEEEEKEKEEEKDKGGVGEKLILPRMLTIWQKSNPTYKVVKERDLPALREFAVFISGRNGIEHLSQQEHENLMQEWGKWCKHIRGTPSLVKKALATIAKFDLQDIDQQLKNSHLHGTHKQNNSKPIPQTVSIGGFGKL